MGTVVEFRTGVRDKIAYALRWLRVARSRGARVRVLADGAELQQLSQQLWVSDKESFLAHAMAGRSHGPGLERTPLWLGEGAIVGDEPPLLLNIGTALPVEPARYERIVEVVSADDDDARAGRERWAGYRRHGLEPEHRREDNAAGAS